MEKEGGKMSLQTPAFIPRDMRSNMLFVYCYQDKNPKGYVHSPWTGERHRFSSAMELLLCLEALMDERNSPRPTTELRGKHEAFRLEYDEETEGKPIASFKIDVLFRYNSTWQGNLLWIEKGQEAQFRSVLELMVLMDNVLTGTV